MGQTLQVGITGGIGSGKSLVCRIFKCLGVAIYDADSRAKSLMTSDPSLIDQIKGEFGNQSYKENGSLDRSYLSEVFGNPEKLIKLNSLVHPRVAEDYRLWVQTQQGQQYVLREAALLYEVGAYTSVNKMIVVFSPEAIRIKRVMERDNRSEEGVKAIIKNQWPEEEKLKRADYIIYNDEKHMIIPQVLQIHKQLTAN